MNMLLSTIDFRSNLYKQCIFTLQYTKLLLFTQTKPIAVSGRAVKTSTFPLPPTLQTATFNSDKEESDMKLCENNTAELFPCVVLCDAVPVL